MQFFTHEILHDINCVLIVISIGVVVSQDISPAFVICHHYN